MNGNKYLLEHTLFMIKFYMRLKNQWNLVQQIIKEAGYMRRDEGMKMMTCAIVIKNKNTMNIISSGWPVWLGEWWRDNFGYQMDKRRQFLKLHTKDYMLTYMSWFQDEWIYISMEPK